MRILTFFMIGVCWADIVFIEKDNIISAEVDASEGVGYHLFRLDLDLDVFMDDVFILRSTM